MTKKDNDPFGFNKAINWDKLEDPKVLKELKELLSEANSTGDVEDVITSIMRRKMNGK